MGGGVQPVARSDPPEEVVWVMAQQTRIKWNKKGFEEILSSSGARAACEGAGSTIMAIANDNNTRGGEGFRMSSRNVKAYGSMRNMTFVYTTDRKSMIAEAEDKALSRAVSG